MKVLLVRPSALGDVVCTLPALADLAAAVPGLRIGWAVREDLAPLLQNHPLIHRLHPAPRRWWLGPLLPRAARRRAAEFRRGLREESYDLAIDLAGIVQSALVLRASGAPQRWGPRRAREAAWLFYGRRLAMDPGVHAVERFRSLVRPLLPEDWTPGPPSFPLPDKPQADAAVAERLRAAALEGRPWVVLHAGAGKATNRWPLRHWKALARSLADRGVGVVLSGSGRERRSQGALPADLDLRGELDLPGLAALMRRAPVVVAGDTGPMHLAAALGRPCVALFGAADPTLTGPWSCHGGRVVERRLPCGPCLADRCPLGTHDCMEGLAPDDVLAAVQQALGDGGAGGAAGGPTPGVRAREAWHRRLKRYAAWAGIRSFTAVFRATPWRVGCGLGQGLGLLVWALASGDRRRAVDQLDAAFGAELGGRAGAAAVARRTARHLGRSGAEMLMLAGRSREAITALVANDDEAVRSLGAHLEGGRGVLVVTGHVGNWELLGAWAALRFPVTVVARRLYYDGFDAVVSSWRDRLGMNTVYTHESPRRILKALRRGDIVGMLPDQDMARAAGVFVPFFGRPAWTPTAPAVLAAKAGAPLVPVFIARLPDGRFRIDVHPAIIRPDTGDAGADAASVTAAWTAVLEGHIRRHPEQWIWQHKRWKTRP